MKITIIALVATLCLAGVQADLNKPDAVDALLPGGFSEEVVGDEAFSIFGSFYWALKATLRTLKGVNCTIKEVIVVKNSALAFIDDINACGSDAVAAFTNVIASAKSVITISNNIINLNENVCNNDESTNGKPSTPLKCFGKLLNQLLKLSNQIQKTITAIKKVPAVPSDAAVCTNTAVSTFTNVLTSFTADVSNCSKLVS